MRGSDSKPFLVQFHPVLAAGAADALGEVRTSAEEDVDRLRRMGLSDERKLAIPVGPPHVRTYCEPSEEIGMPAFLIDAACQVGEGRGRVATSSRHEDMKLDELSVVELFESREQLEEPLERIAVVVEPEEMNLLEW